MSVQVATSSSRLAALCAFHEVSDFETAVLKPVDLGLDTDTADEICGQLAGAYWDELRIPVAGIRDWQVAAFWNAR